MKKALLLFAILFGISFLGFAQENFSINLGYRFKKKQKKTAVRQFFLELKLLNMI